MNPELLRLAYGEITEPIPIGRVDSKISRMYKSESRWVYLSRETLLKQRLHHPEIALDFYRDLEWLLVAGEHINNKRSNCFHIVTSSEGGEIRWKATLKVVRTNRRLLVLSIHQLRKRDYDRLVRRAKS